MKTLNCIIACVTILSAISAQAEWVQVPTKDIATYKAALEKEVYWDYRCKASVQFPPDDLRRSSNLPQAIIRNSTQVFIDHSETSPALLFRYSVEGKITDLYLDVSPDRKQVVNIRGETRQLSTVNKGTLVAPIMVEEYVQIGALTGCK